MKLDKIFKITVADVNEKPTAIQVKTVYKKLLTFLHPNISMHILLTVLYTFPMILTKRICLTIKGDFSW